MGSATHAGVAINLMKASLRSVAAACTTSSSASSSSLLAASSASPSAFSSPVYTARNALVGHIRQSHALLHGGKERSVSTSTATFAAAGYMACMASVPTTTASGGARAAARFATSSSAATAPAKAHQNESSADTREIRNIGISAHIDSGKTTLTERILFYTGRIRGIHEVRGRDGVGATMDSMELEREKGITIQSAATFCEWKGTHVNVIDTPGHVDFTVEVERALRVLDGAVLVLCGVGGVQSQSITVDRQMRRYGVPRLCFVNKLDRAGADPDKVIAQLRSKLRLHCAAVQMPIGLEDEHQGVIDLVDMKSVHFMGEKGRDVVYGAVPDALKEEAEERRANLVEKVADVDDELAEIYLQGDVPDAQTLADAIRRATLKLEFAPVFMGSAFKNKGVQPLLDAVTSYLPRPDELHHSALNLDDAEAKIQLDGKPDSDVVALAFKLEEGKYGQLTYVRVYQGTLRKGDVVVNTTSGKKTKLPRLVRMHADEMVEVESASAGEICAVFGVQCSSGDTFTSGTKLAMESMRVPDPVMSLAIEPKDKSMAAGFSKALAKFTREDPTFKVGLDPDSNQTIISGMGELHLDIYCERLKREYKVDVESGKPKVNFKETITRGAKFDYLHKKQSGGQGQFGRVQGIIEPIAEEDRFDEDGKRRDFEFVNELFGNAIPPGFVTHIEKGFREAANCGSLIGHSVEGVRVILQDGAAHAVDSSELAFKIAALHAFRQAYASAEPAVLEPVMKVEVVAPVEFQGPVVASINRRKGVVMNSEQEGDDVLLDAEVPLNNMFGYSTDLRSMTQGKGEFSMAYARHAMVSKEMQAELEKTYARQRSGGS